MTFPFPPFAPHALVPVVWNSSDKGATISLSTTARTNDTAAGSGGTWNTVRGTTSKNSGQYYFEVKNIVGSNMYVGVADGTAGILTSLLTSAANSAGMDVVSGASTIGVAGSGWTANSTSSPGFAANDIMQVAIDLGAGKLWFGKNNTWVTGSPSGGTSPTISFPASSTLFPAISCFTASDKGQLKTLSADLSFSPPAGFAAWAP